MNSIIKGTWEDHQSDFQNPTRIITAMEKEDLFFMGFYSVTISEFNEGEGLEIPTMIVFNQENDQLWLYDGHKAGYSNRPTQKMLQNVGWTQWEELSKKVDILDLRRDSEGNFIDHSVVHSAVRQNKTIRKDNIYLENNRWVFKPSLVRNRYLLRDWEENMRELLNKVEAIYDYRNHIESITIYATHNKAIEDGYKHLPSSIISNPEVKACSFIIKTTDNYDIWFLIPEIKVSHVLASDYVKRVLDFIDVNPSVEVNDVLEHGLSFRLVVTSLP